MDSLWFRGFLHGTNAAAVVYQAMKHGGFGSETDYATQWLVIHFPFSVKVNCQVNVEVTCRSL